MCAWCVVLLLLCPGPALPVLPGAALLGGTSQASSAQPLPVRHRGDARGNHGAPLHDRVHLPTYLPVSWATWLLYTGVRTPCVVLCVRCPGPLSSCSPVCMLGVSWCVCGVLGPLTLVHRCARPVCCAVSWDHLARVHRCARSVCCAVGCLCGASLRGAHSSILTAAFCSRQGLGTLRAHARPSGWQLFRSRPVLGSLPGAHMSVWTEADVAWHLSS